MSSIAQQEQLLRPRDGAPARDLRGGPAVQRREGGAQSTLGHVWQEITSGARDLGEAIANPGAVMGGNERIALVNLETLLDTISQKLRTADTWVGRTEFVTRLIPQMRGLSSRVTQIRNGLGQVSRAVGAAQTIAQALSFARQWSEAEAAWTVHRGNPTHESAEAVARATGRVMGRLGQALGRLPAPVGPWAALLERANEAFWVALVTNGPWSRTDRELRRVGETPEAADVTQIGPPSESGTQGERGLR